MEASGLTRRDLGLLLLPDTAAALSAGLAAVSSLSSSLSCGYRGRFRGGQERVPHAAHRVLREVRPPLHVAAGLADLGVAQDLHDRGHVDPEFVQDRAGGVRAPSYRRRSVMPASSSSSLNCSQLARGSIGRPSDRALLGLRAGEGQSTALAVGADARVLDAGLGARLRAAAPRRCARHRSRGAKSGAVAATWGGTTRLRSRRRAGAVPGSRPAGTPCRPRRSIS